MAEAWTRAVTGEVRRSGWVLDIFCSFDWQYLLRIDRKERKESGVTQVFGLSKWEDGVTVSWMGKTVQKAGSGTGWGGKA